MVHTMRKIGDRDERKEKENNTSLRSLSTAHTLALTAHQYPTVHVRRLEHPVQQGRQLCRVVVPATEIATREDLGIQLAVGANDVQPEVAMGVLRTYNAGSVVAVLHRVSFEWTGVAGRICRVNYRSACTWQSQLYNVSVELASKHFRG